MRKREKSDFFFLNAAVLEMLSKLRVKSGVATDSRLLDLKRQKSVRLPGPHIKRGHFPMLPFQILQDDCLKTSQKIQLSSKKLI